MLDNIHYKKGAAAIEELLRRIQELEDDHAHLNQQMLNLIICRDRQLSDDFKTSNISSQTTVVSEADEAAGSSSYFISRPCPPSRRGSGRMTRQSPVILTESQCFNILESIDLPISINDTQGILFYRNPAWERVFGYTGAEALGKPILELIVEPCDAMIAQDIMQQMYNEGKCWTGEFPVRNKQGDKFVSFATNKTLVDENGAPVGIISMIAASHPCQLPPAAGAPCQKTQIIMPPPPQPPPSLQSAIASKISELAAKVKYWEIKEGEKQIIYDHEGRGNYKSGGGRDQFSFIMPPPPTTCPPANNNAKADEWMIKHGMAWPWKGNEREGYCFISETGLFCGQWLRSSGTSDYNNYIQQMHASSVHHPAAGIGIVQPWWSSFDIKWEDLIIKERIINGRGSCGSVNHAVWYGSDVALKLFSGQECSRDHLIQSFWQEVSLMKRLRHPNILLFMGAVLSPHHLCIVTEFLRRGSLFQLIHRKNRVKLNWRHRVHMAMDIARGMNHLHHCLPPIIHCDLTSSNILVDNNWIVKIGDFGHCRIKHRSYVTRKKGIVTSGWHPKFFVMRKQMKSLMYIATVWCCGNLPQRRYHGMVSTQCR